MQPIQLLQEAAQRAGQRTGAHLPTLTRSDQVELPGSADHFAAVSRP